MRITVAVCTHDRCRMLAETLRGMEELEVPDGVAWELLVVPNRCTDRTGEVIDRHRDRLPLRSIEEPALGLCHARNAAVEAARGDYIVWTDDDVRVDPDWLASYAEAFRRWPEASFYGGPVEPVFESGRVPEWLDAARRKFPSVFAGRDLGEQTFRIESRGEVPFGANYALPLELQRTVRYDPELGRRGSDLVSGEETELLGRLLSEGHHGRWLPEARVRHRIPPERQTIRYFRRFFRTQGRLAAGRERQRSLPSVLGRPRWAWRAAVEMEIRYRTARATSSPDVWIPLLKRAAYAQGIVLGPPDRDGEGKEADSRRREAEVRP